MTLSNLLVNPIDDSVAKMGEICYTSVQGVILLEPKDYVVLTIEGEYAYLRDIENPNEEPLFIALALLPPGVDVGTRLHYEMLSYEIV